MKFTTKETLLIEKALESMLKSESDFSAINIGVMLKSDNLDCIYDILDNIKSTKDTVLGIKNKLK